MSQLAKITVVSMVRAAPKNFGVTQRKRAERAKRKAAGQVAVTVHIDPRCRQAVRTVEAILNAGGQLASRLVRYLAILNDMLPEKRRARSRLPRVTPAEAKAASAEVILLSRRAKS